MIQSDTIAAISTAPGRAAIAVVRVSGRETAAVARGLGLTELPPRRPSLALLRHPEDGRAVDRVLATFFAAPASYTGEDLLELSCHGGAMAPQLVLDAVLAAGARPAQPGEFTRRALLHGKLDLLQAEATLDLIEARAPAQQQAALFQLERGLSERLELIRSRLLELQGLLAYDIDFPEEDEGPVDPERILDAGRALRADLEAMLELAPEGALVRDGALTVIAGRPNTGKSSLFNALLGHQRAIVTDLPGTTRDAIEAWMSVEGYPFRLVDTAGLRVEAEAIEEMGIEVARGYLAHADIVLLCVEAGRALEPDERDFVERCESGRAGHGGSLFLVRTKSDLAAPDPGSTESVGEPSVAPRVPSVRVAALQGDGIRNLRQALLDATFAGVRQATDAPLVTRGRHVRGLRAATGQLTEFEEALARRLPAEIAATHLQDATLCLEELLGVVTSEDVLDVVFREFCVGK